MLKVAFLDHVFLKYVVKRNAEGERTVARIDSLNDSNTFRAVAVFAVMGAGNRGTLILPFRIYLYRPRV